MKNNLPVVDGRGGTNSNDATNVVPFNSKEKVEYKTSLRVGEYEILEVPLKKDSFKNLFFTVDTFKKINLIVQFMEENNLTIFKFKDIWSQLNENRNEKKGNEKEVVDYVLNVWLKTYYEWRMDIDKKSIFEKCLRELPNLHQSIIEKKYLELDQEGKLPLDDFVYNELHIGRSYYYEKKKEALYWLGLNLCNNSFLVNEKGDRI